LGLQLCAPLLATIVLKWRFTADLNVQNVYNSSFKGMNNVILFQNKNYHMVKLYKKKNENCEEACFRIRKEKII
jgi:hypothetical protein